MIRWLSSRPYQRPTTSIMERPNTSHTFRHGWKGHPHVSAPYNDNALMRKDAEMPRAVNRAAQAHDQAPGSFTFGKRPKESGLDWYSERAQCSEPFPTYTAKNEQKPHKGFRALKTLLGHRSRRSTFTHDDQTRHTHTSSPGHWLRRTASFAMRRQSRASIKCEQSPTKAVSASPVWSPVLRVGPDAQFAALSPGGGAAARAAAAAQNEILENSRFFDPKESLSLQEALIDGDSESGIGIDLRERGDKFEWAQSTTRIGMS